MLLGLLHGVFAKMENTGGQYRICMADFYAINQMIKITDTAGGDDRNIHRIGNGTGNTQIKTGLHTVTIHGGQQNFTSAVLSHFHCPDRKSTRLNSSHVKISYAVFCLKKKNTIQQRVPSPTVHTA